MSESLRLYSGESRKVGKQRVRDVSDQTPTKSYVEHTFGRDDVSYPPVATPPKFDVFNRPPEVSKWHELDEYEIPDRPVKVTKHELQERIDSGKLPKEIRVGEALRAHILTHDLTKDERPRVSVYDINHINDLDPSSWYVDLSKLPKGREAEEVTAVTHDRSLSQPPGLLVVTNTGLVVPPELIQELRKKHPEVSDKTIAKMVGNEIQNTIDWETFLRYEGLLREFYIPHVGRADIFAPSTGDTAEDEEIGEVGELKSNRVPNFLKGIPQLMQYIQGLQSMYERSHRGQILVYDRNKEAWKQPR